MGIKPGLLYSEHCPFRLNTSLSRPVFGVGKQSEKLPEKVALNQTIFHAKSSNWFISGEKSLHIALQRKKEKPIHFFGAINAGIPEQ